MSLERACPCLGPPARLVRIRIGGSLGRRFSPSLSFRAIAASYYVIRSFARRSNPYPTAVLRRDHFASPRERLCLRLRVYKRGNSKCGSWRWIPMDVQFVTSIAPIVRDADAARSFHRDALGLTFEGQEGDYLFTHNLEGTKHFGLWPQACCCKPGQSPQLEDRTCRCQSAAGRSRPTTFCNVTGLRVRPNPPALPKLFRTSNQAVDP